VVLEGDKRELTLPRDWSGFSDGLCNHLDDPDYNILALDTLIVWRALGQGGEDEEPVKETISGQVSSAMGQEVQLE
jgi:hypothetical protein